VAEIDRTEEEGQEHIANNNPTPEGPETNLTEDNPKLSTQVDLRLDMAPGMRVRVTLEALEDDDQGGGNISVDGIRVEAFPDGDQPVNLFLRLNSGEGTVVEIPGTQPRKQPQVRPWLAANRERLRTFISAWPHSLGMTLFGLAISIYLLTRLVGLSAFPIYFFSDEANQTILAQDLVRDNFKSTNGEFLPTYFYNVDKYSLSASVYLQVLPYLVIGKSVFVTRATSVLVTLLAAVEGYI